MIIISLSHSYMRNEVHSCLEWLHSSPFSLRQLGFIIGVLLLIDGMVGAIVHIVNLEFTQLLINMTTLLIGGCAMMIEYQKPMLPSSIKNFLKVEALFIFHPYGRPLVYLLWGILITSSGGFLSPIAFEALCIGFLITIFALISVFHTCWAHGGANRLKAKNLKRDTLMQAFNKADVSKDGQLSSSEFLVFLRTIDMELTSDSMEAILLEVDSSHDEVVDVNEFLEWYSNNDEENHV
jgi:EF-hand domain pair